jgi:glycerophosphoryl diester phosphodiesterase
VCQNQAPQPEVVAHRGASTHRAEHTLAAYALAIEQGADGVECDVRLSRDGHLVCLHDRTVNRTSSGRGVVSELSLKSLAALDFGHWHDEPAESADELVRHPLAAPSAERHRRGLLTLDALLALVHDAGRPIKLFVETKHPVRYAGLVEAKLLALLARHGMLRPADKQSSRVVVMSFSSRAIRRVRSAAPKLPTVQLWRFVPARYRDGGLPPWADITGPSIRWLRTAPDYVARATERGHPTYCWTVDDPADMARCRHLGVRYLATNTPGAARKILPATSAEQRDRRPDGSSR